ncbi:hypothetical protein BU15DRAFT_90809 [Melanogaster broomeanus]|nr:hypothetical protein BU15DRAFT_90809 [Melanogaster broomeanus]
MQETSQSDTLHTDSQTPRNNYDADLATPPLSQSVGPSTGTRGNTPNGRLNLTVKTHNAPTTRSSGPGATATSVNPAVLRGTSNNSAPGGVKAECSNCSTTHTPLWRRGLNDELNCNACGLYCKLHKRPRPKSMRANHGETHTQAAPRQEMVDVMAQCYNCHTTATPLWRKDDKGKTVCNAYKLHGSASPISMKSDVIRKRASRHPSPTVEPSPTLAPDSTTQPTYEYNEETTTQSTSSELMGALGQDAQNNIYVAQSAYSDIFNPFPGPYHPDYLSQNFQTPSDALPFSTVEMLDTEVATNEQRVTKRCRMSRDSVSEPPSSAVLFSSYADSYSGHSSATSHSRSSSMDFPFFSSYSIFRGSGKAFWHPPMLAADRSPQFNHPPMLPAEESPMDFLHPPMLPQEEDNLFATYLQPPKMLPAEDSNVHQQQQNQQQNQRHQNYPGEGFGTSQTEFYDSVMQTY